MPMINKCRYGMQVLMDICMCVSKYVSMLIDTCWYLCAYMYVLFIYVHIYRFICICM